MPKKLTVGSLFSGYGGLDIATEAVTGATPAWFCEHGDAPAKILAHHWPNIPNYRDVTAVDWASLPPVDIITGGSPCQDLNLAGARRGMTYGTRSNLWVSMREAIATIRPRLVVWENVRGALSATATSDSDMEQGGGLLGGGGRSLRALGRVLGDLTDPGYDAQWTTLRASDVGAPHHRSRVFLIAFPADTDRIVVEAGGQSISGSAQFPKPDCGERTFPEALSYLPTPNASDGSGGGQPMSRRAGHSRQLIDAVLDLPHLPTLTVGDKGGADSCGGAGFGAPLGQVVKEFLPTFTASPLDSLAIGGRLDQLSTQSAETSASVFGKYALVVHRWENITGALAPPPTELNSNGRPRLNAAFAEWMMGLPAGWITAVPEVSRAQQLEAIGNGVCPPQAVAALRFLLDPP